MIDPNECEFIWKFPDGYTEYEDEWGYRHLIKEGEEELTQDMKCIDCWYASSDEWYWQDENGHWQFGNKHNENEYLPFPVHL
jgi:hypothetical protein